MQTTRLYSIFIGLFLAQSAYAMHNYNGRLTVPQTNALLRPGFEEQAEAKANAEALAASKADAKSSMEAKTNAANMSPIFENTPRVLQTHIRTYDLNPWSCCEAWLTRRTFNIDHETVLKFIALSETTAATFSEKTIKIWDLTNQKLIATVPEQNKQIHSLIKVSDHIIAFGLPDGSIRLWDIRNNRCIATASHDDSRYAIGILLKFSDNYIISSSIQSLVVWDISDVNNIQATIISDKFTARVDVDISKISDRSIALVSVVEGKKLLRIFDIFDENNKIKLIPTLKTSIELPELENYEFTLFPLDSTTLIYADRVQPSNLYKINLQTNNLTPLIKKNLIVDFQYCGAFNLVGNQFIAYTPHDLCVWDGRDTNNMVCVASLSSSGDRYRKTIKLSDTSFAYLHRRNITVCESDNIARQAFNNLSVNEQRRLQALIYQLRRLNIERIDSAQPADPIELTAWGEKWLAAMPEAIQKRLRANFNIATLPEIG